MSPRTLSFLKPQTHFLFHSLTLSLQFKALIQLRQCLYSRGREHPSWCVAASAMTTSPENPLSRGSLTSSLWQHKPPRFTVKGHRNSSPQYLQVAISLLLTKITVFIFLIASPRQRFRKLLVPLLLSKTRTHIFLIILLCQGDDEQ